MKLLVTALATLTITAGAIAADGIDPQKPAQTMAAPEASNTVCPVSGDKVGDMGKPVYVEYQGKKVALCCKQCKKDFDKDPAKFTSLAEKNQAGSDGGHSH
jgi:YHS domain-containing protein